MNKQVLHLIIFSIIMIMPNSLSAQQNKLNNNQKAISLFVEFQFETKDINLAIELLTNMQNKVIEHEEGCIVYDILLSEEESNTIYLYECYENKAALDIHNKAPYFKDIVEKQLAPLIKNQKILKLHPINEIGAMM
ncbi:MAG: antibiotic biosynthesis monooxygenase [Bacteroidales bacterium]|nr:antibiotic biosynthesis monooxygenase [Bacteroidales bacterium]